MSKKRGQEELERAKAVKVGPPWFYFSMSLSLMQVKSREGLRSGSALVGALVANDYWMADLSHERTGI